MLHPKNYLESCTALLGYKDVIDHDPGYVSPHKIDKWKLSQNCKEKWNKFRASILNKTVTNRIHKLGYETLNTQ